jgi:methyltransferase (TIGR00027 family)
MHIIDRVGRMALIFAAIRARESARAGALFQDPYAVLFDDPEIVATARGWEAQAPFLTNSVRARTHWFDEVVGRSLDAGTRQVILLGSGLDCRSLRLRRPGVRYFEVDRQAVLAYKRQILEGAGHRHDAEVVLADYTQPGVVRALVAKGLDPAAKTLVLWEGNTYFLTPLAIRQVLRSLDASLGDVRVAFDHFGSAVIEGRSASPSMVVAIPILRRLGAPWLGGIDDVQALAGETGLRVEEGEDIAQLQARVARHGVDFGQDKAAEYGTCVLTNR